MNENTISNHLPDLQEDYKLSSDDIANFRENGHILLRSVASSEEIAAFRPVITSAADRYNTETRALAERDTYGKAFLQIMNLWEQDAKVRHFVLARRFAKIAAELLEVPAVRIYHDQALFKEPGGGYTPWHQDHYYWPLSTDKAITMWMPLTDVSEDMGPMTFVSGSQREGYLGKFSISDESQAKFQQMIKERGLKTISYGMMKAGDATFHASWMLHAAGANTTSRLREVMTIIYFADGVRTMQPDNEGRVNDLKRWLPDVQPGEIAASVLNPLVYSASQAQE